MTHQDIIAHLCQLQPPEVIHEITTETIISKLVRCLGKEALGLSAEDLELSTEEIRSAIEEVDAALQHHMNERDFIEIGLDAWEIVRNL